MDPCLRSSLVVDVRVVARVGGSVLYRMVWLGLREFGVSLTPSTPRNSSSIHPADKKSPSIQFFTFMAVD
jgi:hypothetical protein